jgi:hypothetical protein
MPNAQAICYVTRDGAHGRSSELPEGAIAIGEEQFNLIAENPGLIDVRIEGTVVHIRPSLFSYKKQTIATIKILVQKHIPDEARMNNLFRAAVQHIGCFDYESGLLLDKDETAGNAEALHLLYNDLRYLEHKYISKVNAADDVQDIDRIVEAFERTIQGIV